MNKHSDFQKIYENISKQLSKVEQDTEFSEDFYTAFLSGDNTLYQKYVKETKKFDEEWIVTVESYIPSLNKIVMNPKSALKTMEEITVIEKAKKTNSLSIKHLSANTHLIRDINEFGEVIPKKILTTYSDIDYGTYENRLVMTLIDRLFIFVKTRYDLIKKNVKSYEKRRFYLNSSFPVNDTKVDLELNFLLTDELEETKINDYNKNLLTRAEYLYKVVSSLKSSKFMDLMKDQKKIYPPIIKTNIIQKNIDYRNVYMLWLFIDRFNTLAFTIDIEEKNLVFTKDYYNAINRQVMMIYMMVVENQAKNKKIYQSIRTKKYNKKSIKVVKNHPDDFKLTEEDEQLEDQTLNQYYLEASKRIFKQSLEYHGQNAKTYETTLKRALKDTLNISNALYQSFFEMEDDDLDIFNKLIRGTDVQKDLNDAKRKSLIAKLIREVKEVDFNDSVRQEIKFLDDIIKYNESLIQDYQEQEELAKEDLERINTLELNKQIAKEDKLIQLELLQEVKRMKAEVDVYRKKVLDEIRTLEKELRDNYTKNIEDYKNQLREERKIKIQQYIEENRPKKRLTNEKIKKEKELIDLERIEKEQSLREEYTQKQANEVATLFKDHTKDLQEKENFYKNRLAENEANIRELNRYIKESDRTIFEHEKELKQNQRETIKRLKAEQEKILKEKIHSFKEKYAISKRVTKSALMTQTMNLATKLNQNLLKLEAKYDKELNDQIDLIVKRNLNDINKAEAEIKKKYDENQLNIKQLDQIREAFKKAIKEVRKLENA